MDDILTNHQIPGAVIDLIEETNDYCFLVTPYYRSWILLERALEKAAKKEKKIVFIFRAQENNPGDLLNLNYRYGFDLYFVNNLHTKLYLNERKVILSSMNLYDSSKERNFEIGYILQGSHIAKKFKEKVIDNDILSLEAAYVYEGRYIRHIKEKEEEARRKEQDKKMAQERPRNNSWGRSNNTGYCIRCGGRLDYYNPARPFCISCFQTWSQYGNCEYRENFCHSCGQEYATNFNMPLCNRCYREINNNML